MTTTESTHAPGAHYADPGALGLGAFATTTFVLSVINAGMVDAEPVVFGMALAFGGIAQFAAGLWEFAKGNTFGATAFCSFGAFWVSFWYLTGHTDLSGVQSSLLDGLGLYLLAWAIFTLYMTVAALKTNLVILTVFVLLTITFFLLSIGDFTAVEMWTKVGGWFGIATAVAAWYGSMAVVSNATFKRTVFPVWPR